jgi:hypothetical protein
MQKSNRLFQASTIRDLYLLLDAMYLLDIIANKHYKKYIDIFTDLRQPTADGLAPTSGLSGQSQADPAMHAAAGAGGDRSETEVALPRSRAGTVSVCVTGCGHDVSDSGVGDRHPG